MTPGGAVQGRHPPGLDRHSLESGDSYRDLRRAPGIGSAYPCRPVPVLAGRCQETGLLRLAKVAEIAFNNPVYVAPGHARVWVFGVTAAGLTA